MENAARHLLAVLDAHEIESLDCDRRGVEWCDCLEKAKKALRELLPRTEHEDNDE